MAFLSPTERLSAALAEWFASRWVGRCIYYLAFGGLMAYFLYAMAQTQDDGGAFWRMWPYYVAAIAWVTSSELAFWSIRRIARKHEWFLERSEAKRARKAARSRSETPQAVED